MISKSMTIPILAFLFSMPMQSSWAAQAVTNYSMPLPGPEYGAPPRTYYDSKLVTITFKTTPEALQKLIPKPMVPNPENLVSVYF